MKRELSAVSAFLVMHVLCGCEGGGVGKAWTSGAQEAIVEASPSPLVFDVQSTGDGPEAKTVHVRNVGFGAAPMSEIAVANAQGQAGRFVLAQPPARAALAPGEGLDLEVVFQPGQDDVSGCDLFGLGHLTIAGPFGSLRVPLLQRGACTEPLLWAPRQVRFPGSLVGGHHTRSVVFANPSEAPVTVERISLAPATAATYSIASLSASLPRELRTGEELTVDIAYEPQAATEDSGTVVVSAGGRDVSISLWGTAERLRPRCADGVPSPPEPIAVGPGYELTLIPTHTESYSGTTRAVQLHNDFAPAVADVLLTSGAYNDPACSVTYDAANHSVHWTGNACTTGGDLALLYPVPASADVDRWLRTIEPGDEVRVSGYLISEIRYDDGFRRWANGQAYFLLATWVCDP